MNSTVNAMLEFARAERPWEDVHIPGVEVDFDRWKIREPAASPELAVMLSPSDVALGFTRLINDRLALRRWAFVILAASDHFVLSNEFEGPAGEELLEALWDASFGEPIHEKSVLCIQKLASDAFRSRRSSEDVVDINKVIGIAPK